MRYKGYINFVIKISAILLLPLAYCFMEYLRKMAKFKSDFEMYRFYINIEVILGVIVIYIIVKSIVRKQFDIPIQNHVKRFKWYDKASFIVIALLCMDFFESMASELSKIVFKLSGNAIPKNQQHNNEGLENNPLWYSLFDSSVNAPIIEEIMFRGVGYLLLFSLAGLIKNYKAKWNIVIYALFILISGTYFGYRHVEEAGDYQFILPFIVSGIVLSIVFVITKNIVYSMSVHAIGNMLGTLNNAQVHHVSNISGYIGDSIAMALWVYIIIYAIVKIIKHREKINAKINAMANKDYADIKKTVNRNIEKL